MNKICLNKDQLDKLKLVGMGTDGIVYEYNRDILLKVYHSKLSTLVYNNYNDSDIKLYNRGDYRNKKNINDYENQARYYAYDKPKTDEEIKLNQDNPKTFDVRLRSKDAINKAVERQQNVLRTDLPLGSLYLDNRFVGCYIKKEKGIPIHSKKTSRSNKIKILENVLLDVEELLNNYIYHIDLGNSPYALGNYYDNNGNVKTIKGHSHVLVEPFTLKTNIIDLDGKSTIYQERYNRELERQCLEGLRTLIGEYYFDYNDNELLDETAIPYIYEDLKNQGVNDEFALKFAQDDIQKLDDLRKVLKK